MIDDFIKHLYKNNQVIGLIVGGTIITAYIVEIINNLRLLRKFPFTSPWLFLLLGIVLIYISINKRGDFSYEMRKLGRAGFILLSQIFFVFYIKILPFQNLAIGNFLLIFTCISLLVFLLINYYDKNSKDLVVIFCEFSDSASEDIPKDRHITHYVREIIRNEYKDQIIKIKYLDKVILDDQKAMKIGSNAGALAVIYGIITQVHEKIKLDLRFSIVRKPSFIQPIDIKKRILPIEELASGNLESYIGIDYSALIEFLLGLFDYSRQEFEKAKTRFSNVLNMIEDHDNYSYSISNEIVYLCLGNSYYLLGDLFSAQDTFNKAINQNPCLPKILHNLGLIELQLSNFDPAIELMSKAIFLDSSLYIAYRNRGFIYFQNEQYLLSIKDLIKYLVYQPNDKYALRWIGLCYSNLGQHDEAIKFFRKALIKSRDFSVVFEIIDELIIEKKFLIALIGLSLVSFHPTFSSHAYGSLADFCKENNRLNLAEILYSLAVLINWKNPHLYFSRSDNRALNNDYLGAKKDLLKTISLEPNLDDAYFNLGNILMVEKNYQEAVNYYSAALSLCPNSPDALINRAQGNILLSKYDEAINDAKKYIEFSGDFEGKGHKIIKYARKMKRKK